MADRHPWIDDAGDLNPEIMAKIIGAAIDAGLFGPGRVWTYTPETPGSAFETRDFGRWQDKTRTASHRKSLEQLRSMARLRDNPAAFQGERDNAQAAMDRIFARTGLKETDL